MVPEKRTVYLSAPNPERCLWREGNSPRLEATALLLGIEHNVLALLVKLIEALAEGLLGLMSRVNFSKTFYETMTIQAVLQPC
jgi:hypothetical protein